MLQVARQLGARALRAQAPAALTTALRGKATDAGSKDFVFDYLKEEVSQLQTFLNSCKKIYYPLGESDNDDKVRKFSEELAAAKKATGTPDSLSRMKNLLGFYEWQSGDSVREYFNFVSASMRPENSSAAMQALDTVEAKLGKPLLRTDAAGMQAFSEALSEAAASYFEEVEQKTGQSVDAVLQDYNFHEGKAHLKQVEEDAQEAMKKAREGPRIVDSSSFDLSELNAEQLKELKDAMAAAKISENDFKDIGISLKQVADQLHKENNA